LVSRESTHTIKIIEYYAVVAILLLLPLLFNPFSEFAFEAIKVYFLRCVVGIMAVTFAWKTWLRHRIRSNRIRVQREGIQAVPRTLPYLYAFVFVYGTVLVLASITSIDPATSFWGYGNKHGTVTVLVILIFFAIFSNSRPTRDEITGMVAALLIGTIPVSMYGILQAFGIDPLVWDTDSISPVSSTIGRSNFLGAYLALAIPFSFFYFSFETGNSEATPSSRSSKKQLPSLREKHGLPCRFTVLFMLQITCLVLTQSRAALLASTTGGLTYLGLLTDRVQRRRALKLALVISLIAIGTLLLVSYLDLSPQGSETRHGPSTVTFPDLRWASLSSRLTIWRSTLELAEDRWVLGYGPETFVTLFNSRFPPDEAHGEPNVWVDDPHNVFLDHLTATGVIGLLVFVAVLGVFFVVIRGNLRRAGRRFERNLAAAIAGSVTAYLVQAQLNPDVIVTQVLFWWALALGVATARINGRLNDSLVKEW
jgi:O-antigen ligase